MVALTHYVANKYIDPARAALLSMEAGQNCKDQLEQAGDVAANYIRVHTCACAQAG